MPGAGRHRRQFFQSLAQSAKPVLFRLSAVRHSKVGPMKSPLPHCKSLAGKDEAGNVTRVTSRKGVPVVAETRAAFQAARILRARRGIEPRSSEWIWLVLPVASLYMEEKTEARSKSPAEFSNFSASRRPADAKENRPIPTESLLATLVTEHDVSHQRLHGTRNRRLQHLIEAKRDLVRELVVREKVASWLQHRCHIGPRK